MQCWARYILWICFVVLGTGSMLSACGQKGDLYLPDRDRPEQGEAGAQGR
jgi:predicted small lipoprotein YifL